MTSLRSISSSMHRLGGLLPDSLGPVLFWGVLFLGSWGWNHAQLDAQIHELALQRGRYIFEMVEMFRLWNARHGGVYAPITEDNPPNPYLKVPERDIHTPGGLPLTRINPAYMTRQLGDLLARMKETRIHITSLRPINPLNQADPWEANALLKFEADSTEWFELVDGDRGLSFRFMAPLRTSEPCLACHAAQGYKVGDVRGGISVTFPAQPFFQSLVSHQRFLTGLHLVSWLLLSLLTIQIIRRNRAHLARLEQTEAEQKIMVEQRTRELRQEIRERRQSEQRFRSVTQSSVDAIIATDGQGMVTFWNRGAERMFGFAEEEIMGQPVSRIVPETLRDRHVLALSRAAQTPMGMLGRTTETIGQHRDGHTFPLEISLETWQLEGDHFFSAVLRDITERKSLDMRLRLQAAALRAAANAIFITDASGAIQWVNPAFTTLTGFSEAEALGQNARLLNSGHHDTRFFQAMWQTILAGQVWHGEIRNRKKDGTLYIQESLITPVPAADGTIGHFIAIQQDITQRKQTEEERYLFQQAVEQSPITTVITGLDGTIQYVNPTFCQVTGYTREEAIGQNPRLLKTDETDPAVYQDMWRTLAAGQVWRGELLNRKKNDERFWESVLIAPIKDPASGEVTRYMALKEEITQRKRTEAALQAATREAQEANMAKSTFLATMSHEIRTPINAILGMGEILLDTRLTPEQRSFLEVANNAGESLLALVNDILDLSKIEAGQLALEHRPFDLENLVAGTMQILDMLAREKGLVLSHTLAPGVPRWVLGDGSRLRQVLLNLIGNGVKFTAQGSVGLIITRLEGTDLRFEVRDTGMGVPPEKQQMIFEPFSQADASTTRRFGGTGLGLSICRRLVEQGGGRIWVESQPGQGSAFFFTLSLPEVAPPTSGPKPPPPSTDAGGITWQRPLAILLVDDAEDNQLLVRTFLKNTPHHITCADHGAQALELFRRGRFDLVLMDMQMPVMDGFTATRRIRALEMAAGRPRTPVAALTAHTLKEAELQAREAGCDAFLPKPIRKRNLLDFLAAFVPREP
ncbi:MAG: PAS domain S-box protein [Magnetococcales bacterium]|nr:PAS domain S-box protein [Magnetococcales bacterium]